MSDKELLDWIERDGIQIWPIRKSKHGPVTSWYVQNPAPFQQTYGDTVREALHKLAKSSIATSTE